ncbi:MAG TPA: MFS transporter [Devosia sp.]|nr:MFS transporter [Devosia sp.]
MLTGLGHGFVAFAVSVLLNPLAADLGTGRGVISTAIGLGRLVSGVTSPIIGRITDLFGPRWIVVCGMVLMALGLMALGFVRSELGLYFAWSLLVSAGAAAGFTVALDKLVVATVRGKRGMALAVRFSVAAVVSTLLVPFVTVMVELLGWRITCFVWGGLMLLLIPVPLLWFRQDTVPRPVRPVTPAIAGSSPAADAGLRRVIRQPAYWVIAAAFTAQASVTTGLSVHLVPLMTDYGLDAVLAGGLFGLMILLSVPVRLLSGLVADRVHPRHLPLVLGGLLVIEGIAIGSFALAPGFVTMLVVIAALGIAAGAPTLLVLILCGELFGESHFATVQGSLMLLQVPGTMLAPIIAGYAYDFTGSYVGVIGGFAMLLVSGGVLLALLRPDAGHYRSA